MIWENWERDVVLVENILLYFVIVITFVAFVIVLGCSCYKFFRYYQCFNFLQEPHTQPQAHVEFSSCKGGQEHK